MYETFFHLTNKPFSPVADPDCVHLLARQEEVVRGLAFGVRDRRGYMVLTAEAGLGKTTVVRALAQFLIDSKVYVSTILVPTLTSSEFLELLLLNFGFKDIPSSKARRLKLLEDFLIKSDSAGRAAALIVDEAHLLSEESLEEIRLLGNFEAADHKLLQIILTGQNELNDRLNQPQMWQLKQRIVVRQSLQRLNREAVEEYIRYQWTEAGGSSHFPFTGASLDAIAVWSSGIPRIVNSICDNALLIAFSEATYLLDVDMIREACNELMLPTPTFESQLKPPSRPSGEGSSASADEVEPPSTVLPGVVEKSSFVKRWLRPGDIQPNRVAKPGLSILSLNEPRR